MEAYRDAINIKNAIPWLSAEQEVEQFLSSVPQDLHHIRNHLALYRFFKDKDKGLNIPVIEKEAREIVDILKDVSLEEVKYSLLILGDLPNRKEVVLRQLINSVRDQLSNISFDDFKNRKRKEENFPLNGSPRAQSKIRKVEQIENNCDQSHNQIITTSAPESSLLPDSSSANNSESTILDGLSDETIIEINENPTWFDNDDIDMLWSEIINDSNKVTDLELTENNVQNTDIINLDSSNYYCEPSTSEAHQEMPFSRDSRPKKNEFKATYTDEFKANMNRRFKPSTEASTVSRSTTTTNKKLKPSTTTSSNYMPAHGINKPSTSAGYKNSVNGAAKNKPSTITASKNQMQPKPSTSTASSQPPTLVRNKMSILGNNQNMPWLEETKKTAPSTSKRNNISIQPKSVPTTKTFDLVQHLHEITNKSKEEIQMYCDSRNLIVTREPSAIVLNEIVHSLLQGNSHPVSSLNDDETDSSFDEEDNWIHIPSDDPETLTAVQPPIDLTSPAPQRITNSNTSTNLDIRLVNRIKEMFPEACPNYVEDICKGKAMNQLDDVVTVILGTDDKYPRRQAKRSSPERELDPEEQFNILSEILADADPTYLRMQCDLYRNNSEGLKQFIANAIETKAYPTLKEYTRKQQLSAQQKQYTTEFDVENFVQIFPDPFATFGDPKRKLQLSAYDIHFVSVFLRNLFDRVTIRDISKVMGNNNNSNLAKCIKDLKVLVKNGNLMRGKRKPVPLPSNIQNIPLLQEVAFFGHQNEIKEYLASKKEAEEQERKQAKLDGLMQTCSCCYDDEVMPKECFTCDKGCKYCKSCINKYCEVGVGEAKMDFPCMSECDGEFSLQTLQNVLAPKMFSKVAQKKALAEVKAAGIEDLEMCPFCDFATIPYEADKIFRCFNPECMKESCRLCKEPSHVPLKCDEVEQDADVKARTYVEDKMTEALLRECWKCHTKFFKEEGCNKMTCSCGAHMCYICSQPVKDYSHFNGLGGDKHHLCPLYSDTNALNEQNVLKGAEAAKAQIDPRKLKVDPTADVKEHYKERSKKVPREPHMDLVRAMHLPVPQIIDNGRNVEVLEERRRIQRLHRRLQQVMNNRAQWGHF